MIRELWDKVMSGISNKDKREEHHTINKENADKLSSCLRKVDSDFNALAIHIVLNGENKSVFEFVPREISKSDLIRLHEQIILNLKISLLEDNNCIGDATIH